MRASLVVLGIVALCVAGWLLFGFDSPAPPGTASPAGQTHADAIDVRHGDTVADSPDGGTDRSEETEPPMEPARNRVATVAPEDSFALRTVHYADRSPVPGATVWFVEQTEAGLSNEVWATWRDDEIAFARKYLDSVTTDDEGAAYVPRGKRNRLLVASQGDLYGTTFWQDGAEEPLELPMRRDHTVRIRVEDAQGRAARAVPVHVFREGTDEDRPMHMMLGQTDAAGVTSVRHFQDYAGSSASAGLELYCELPGLRSEGVVVESSEPPPEVVLALPATGSVTVRALEADASPLDPLTVDDARVVLTVATQNGNRTGGQSLQGMPLLGRDGTATFPHVALGQRFAVRIFGIGEVECDGPTRLGENVEVDVRRPPGGAFLVGRLLDLGGRRASDTAFSMTSGNSVGMRMSNARTDDDGRFRVWTEPRFVGPAVDLAIQAPVSTQDPRESWTTTIPKRELVAGDNQLGDVRMEKPRPIVAGRLLVDGEPAARSPWFSIERQQGRHWQQVHNTRPIHEEDGRFAVYGAQDTGQPLRLVIRGQNLPETEGIEFEAWTDDLEVDLQSGASITATYVVDDDVPHDRLHYRLERADGSNENAFGFLDFGHLSASRLRPAGDDRYTMLWDGLKPGDHVLSVLAPGDDEPLVRIEGLHVERGPCDDPRLAAIDLRGLVRLLEIRVRDADGAPVKDQNAFVLVGSEKVSGYQLGSGVVKLPVARPVDLWLDAPGHALEKLTAVFTDQDVQLRRTPEATVHIEPVPSGLPEDVRLELQIMPSDIDRAARVQLDTGMGTNLVNHWRQSIPIRADGSGTLQARRPGAYRVRASLVRGRSEHRIRAIDPVEWTITDPPAATTQVFRIPAEALQETRARFD